MWIASSSEMSSLYLGGHSRHQLSLFIASSNKGSTHRFSRKVLALTMFLPIADAFHAQNEPDGSTW